MDGMGGELQVERESYGVWRSGYLWIGRDLSFAAEEGMLKFVVTPTGLYSSETWVLNARKIRVEVFDIMCLRRVLEVNIMVRIMIV